MNKVLSAAIAAALVLLMIVLGVLSMSLGRIVKAAVEAAGPRLLGVPVSVASVTISPLSGRGMVRGLVIGNPDGFKSPHAVSVGSVEIVLKLSSLFSDTVVVERAAVRDPELTWELGPEGSNLTRLSRNAQASAEKLGGGKGGAAAESRSAKKGKSLLIRVLTVDGGKVGLSATALGGQGLSAALPALRLTDLGGPGRSPAEAAAQALAAITRAAQGAASNAGGKAIDAARGAAMKALGDFLNGRRK